MKVVSLAAAAVMVLSPCVVNAATKDGAFSVRGIGSQNCKSVVEAVADKNNGQLASNILGSWIAGYLSHSNRMAAGVFELMPITDTMVVGQMVVNVCEANPDTMVEPAIAIAIKSLNGAAQAADTPIIEISNGKFTTQIRRSVVVEVQSSLIVGKFLPDGSADGSYGPATRDALVAYQKSKGITETGIPDPTTVINLFVADKVSN